MARHFAALLHLSTLAALLALVGCGPSEKTELANLDNQITGNDADPALASALEDQILVDPTLSQQSNRNAVRPPETPVQAQYPVDSGRRVRPATAEAGADEAELRDGACGANFDYGPAWARRLPPGFAVYPGARVTDAAGHDRGACQVRVVTFVSGASVRQMLDWYREGAVRAGYSAEHQLRASDHVLAGTNIADGGAYFLIVSPLPRGGTDVSLIVHNGR